MKFIKENWKIILICLLLVFGMNKCTTSCNRATTINSQTRQIEVLEKQNDSLFKICDLQSLKINEMERGQSALSGLATGNQQLFMDSINILVKENAELYNENAKLKGELSKVKLELKRIQEAE